jgi:hypothetical protein
MKKILKFLTGRLFISILLILLQLATLFAVVVVAKGRWYWSLLFELVSVVMALVIVTRDENPAYKVAWMVVIMFLPVYGALFYLLFGNKREGRYAQRKLNQLVAKYSDKIPVLPGPDMVVREALENFDPMLARQSDYISNISSFPVWRNTEVEYFSLGEYFLREVAGGTAQGQALYLHGIFHYRRGRDVGCRAGGPVAEAARGGGDPVHVRRSRIDPYDTRPFRPEASLARFQGGDVQSDETAPQSPVQLSRSPQDLRNRRERGVHRRLESRR